ncbi:MAG TPA: PilZ domain-containing protein [Vicinamibacterales bacterium]|nr:PilZ domain-containing protein [Vicinamibacterales bacterium]
MGAIATPVRLYDVSAGGCFINSMYEQKPGVKFVLEMDLPLAGVVTVNAEVLYVKPEFGFAVRFIDLSPETKAVLQRSVDAMLGLPPQ